MSDVMTRIIDLAPGMHGLCLKMIILQINSPAITKGKQEVRCVKVADETGSVNMSVWDDLGKTLAPGDIFRLEGGYTSIWKHRLTLYIGWKGVLFQLRKDETSPMRYALTPNMSEMNPTFGVMTYRGKRRNLSRRQYNVVAIAPANSVGPGESLFPSTPIRPLGQEDSLDFTRPGRSVDPPLPIRPLGSSAPPANEGSQITVSPIRSPNAIAAASALVAPEGRPATFEAHPAAAPPAMPEMFVGPTVRPVASTAEQPEPRRGH